METYFQKNLKYLRTQKRISQLNLAQQIGKDQSTIAYWENGKADPTLENVIKISDVLQVPIENFVGKDLTIDDGCQQISELELLFDQNKDILTDDDKDYIKFIIERRRKKVDEQSNL